MCAKRFVVVVNPRGGAGRGLAVLERVRPVFAAADAELDVRVTAGPGHAGELAGTTELGRYDGFCVIGGDGTLHEVAGGLLGRGGPVSIPLGVIPAGTGNSVIRHLECSSPLEAARQIVTGNVRPLDVIQVAAGNDAAYCVNILGWGNVVDILRTAERLRRLGGPQYALAALSQILRGKHRRAKLRLDDDVVEDDFLLAMACNTQFTGKGMHVAPQADIGDGKIDVVLVRRTSRLQMLRLLSKVFSGSHVAMRCVECRQVRSFGIEPQGSDGLNLDGELKCTTPVSAVVVPAALRIFG